MVQVLILAQKVTNMSSLGRNEKQHNNWLKQYLIAFLAPGNANTKYKIWIALSLIIQINCALLPSLLVREYSFLSTAIYYTTTTLALSGLLLVKTEWQKWIAYAIAVYGLSLVVILTAFDLTNTGILIYLLSWSMGVSLGYGRELFSLKWFFGFMSAVVLFFALSLLFTQHIIYEVWEKALLVVSGTLTIGINIFLWSKEAKMSSTHYSERRQKYEDISSLSEKITAILVSSDDLYLTFFDMVKASEKGLDLDYCMIFLIDDKTLRSVDQKHVVPINDKSILNVVIQTEKPNLIADTNLSSFRSLGVYPDAKSELAAPIFNSGKLEGIIYGASLEKDILRERQVEAFGVIASFCGLKLTQRDAESSIREALKTKAEVDQYKELDQLKNRFITNISHDLKTPLSLIKAPAMQIAKISTEERVRNHANYIIKNTDHLLRVVNQLLQLNRLDQGMNQLYLEDVDLAKMIQKLTIQYQGLAEKDSIQFETTGVESRVYTDSFRLEQIIHNLVHNAFRYTGQNGKIELILSIEEEDLIITVRDNGPGIPSDQLESIFQRFTKLNVNNHEGTGIGLSLVKEYSASLGGQVSVSSVLNEGTCFTVRIPNHPVNQENVPMQLEVDDITVYYGKPEVLIVEDHPDLNTFIAASLEEDYHCVSAFDGEDAIKRIRQNVPDLIISDLMMPKMDGLDLIQQIRANEDWCAIPIIVLSAKGQVESKVELYEMGVDNYLVKPFDMIELEAIIKGALEQRRKLKTAFQKAYLENKSSNQESNTTEEAVFSPLVIELIAFVKAHLDDSDLNITRLGQELRIGRNRLQKEVKDATGLTPVELIRSVRLKEAKEMLRDKRRNVSEVAYSVGFNNLSYFSRAFKEEFDQLPSEWQEESSSISN